MTDIEDKSLLRCTIKKSADVLKKVILIVSVVIVLLLGLAIIAKGITVIWDFFWTDIHHWLDIVISIPILFLISIPWYVYVGAVAVLAIPVYSFLWCIARELTEEDWGSDEAKDSVNFIFMSSFILSLFSAFFAYTQSFNSIDMFNFIFGFAMIIALVGVISVFVSEVSLFPGAYLHYRKRMKLSGGVK